MVLPSSQTKMSDKSVKGFTNYNRTYKQKNLYDRDIVVVKEPELLIKFMKFTAMHRSEMFLYSTGVIYLSK